MTQPEPFTRMAVSDLDMARFPRRTTDQRQRLKDEFRDLPAGIALFLPRPDNKKLETHRSAERGFLSAHFSDRQIRSYVAKGHDGVWFWWEDPEPDTGAGHRLFLSLSADEMYAALKAIDETDFDDGDGWHEVKDITTNILQKLRE